MDTPHLNQLSSLSDTTLWTGGWDSTYRVLQRAVLDETTVRPCYVIDRVRRSSGTEIDTMNRLLRTLERHHPEVYERIETPRYVDRRAIPENAAIQDAWEYLRDEYDIGGQYNWIARLAEAAGWTGVELSVYGGGRLRPMFGDYVRPVETAEGRTTYVLGDDAPEPQRLVFGRYAFPFWTTTKQEAFAAADREGLTELLDAHTWFCFEPHNGKPCGHCRPCRFMIKDGLGHRIPRSSHLRYAVAETRMKLGLRTRLRGLIGR